MAFETREEVFEWVIQLDKPLCPHCSHPMSLWEVPDVAVEDGLGWGTPFLFICFNDACKLYQGGWANMKENYGRTASYRCICYPGSEQYECMPVYGPHGGQGQIIDDEALRERELLARRTEEGLARLEGCRHNGHRKTILEILLDSAQPNRVRAAAADMIGEVGESEAVEPLQNQRFGNQVLQRKVTAAIKKIHERHFTRECPFCAEIIKSRAKVCKHCGRDITE